MTELMKPVRPTDAAPVVTALEVQTAPSVRELLTELAALEDALRTTGGSRRDRRVVLAREQEIIAELHRRCPEAPQPS